VDADQPGNGLARSSAWYESERLSTIRHFDLMSTTYFHNEQFIIRRLRSIYDAGSDTCRCPGHQRLRFISQCEMTRRRIYEALNGACDACTLQPQCMMSKRGRRVERSSDETYLNRVCSYHVTGPYAKAMRKWQVWVEPLFAEAKDWHGLRRFRPRGREKVNGEGRSLRRDRT